MKAILLAAGYGTRLKTIAENTPKPLLSINDKPLIEYIIDRLKSLPGLSEVIVVTNNKFCGHFEDWAKGVDYPYPITVVNDGTNTPEERLGSIGDIEFTIEKQSIEDDVVVVGGDNLFDYDLDVYVEFCQQHKDAVTIGLYDIHDLQEAKLFGVVAVDENGKVTSFEEKPAEPKSSLIAMCFYYFPRNTVGLVKRYLDETKKADRAGDYIRWLCEKNDVYGFTFTGKWYDIGSVESYYEAQKNFK